MKRTLKYLAAVAALLLATSSHAAPASVWADAAAAPQADAAKRWIRPAKARLFSLETTALKRLLARLPDEHAELAKRPVLNLPLPDGSAINLRVFASEVMEPALAAQFPQIRTFAGSAEGDARISGRFDLGPRGFHGQIFTPQGTVFIDPYSRGELRYHQAYFTRDMPGRWRAPDRVLNTPDGVAQALSLQMAQAANAGVAPASAVSPAALYTYRLAIATTGEYAIYQDPDHSPPDTAIVLAELVNLVNRVTGVYEREVGVRLKLVANNQRVIYIDPAADPYANDAGTDIYVNTNVLNRRIGPFAYDIGHVVGTGQGGVAGAGICDLGYKGFGATGLPAPVGDPFYIDYVAHEMGHQFSASHTFNGSASNCLANINAATAHEPGSGTTIMAYAGICAEDDLQPHSDANFHAVSFDQIVNYTRSGSAAACAVVEGAGSNQPPVASVPAGGFTIPMQTPFELTGVGSDMAGSALTYQWEQMDLGAQGAPNAPDATAPLFRSFPPSASATRVFPQISDIVNNVQTIGEILPAVSRALNFRFTVRDNTPAPSFGGVASADLGFNVTALAGPFRVLSPNTAGSLKGGSSFTVTWAPAGTRSAPVSCPSVDILLSGDGGLTFPGVLKSSTANDGSQRVKAPKVLTEHGRIKVKCRSNVFFDISDVDFTIN